MRPAFILQTGVAFGGSILYFAHLMDLIGADPESAVIGVDIKLTSQARSIAHPRVRLVEGDSIDERTVEHVRAQVPSRGGLVILDSDHSCAHVTRELDIYSPFVGFGSYLVVEDTNVNGHPVAPDFGPGPYEAVEAFLKRDDRFARDDAIWRRNLFSFHQFGWLVRMK